jgi:hypothetical protein
MEGVTLLVKAYERRDCVATLLASFRDEYPDVPILVADDSRAPGLPDGWGPDRGVKLLPMPRDSGISAGRNLLAHSCGTEICILFDDDFYLRGDSRLHEPVEAVRQGLADLVACLLWDDRAARFWTPSRIFSREGAVLSIEPGHRGEGASIPGCLGRLWEADFVPNCFAARTRTLLDVGWDPRIKATDEHIDFFLRYVAWPYRVAYTDAAIVGHRGGGGGERYLRDRRRRWRDYVLRKHRLTEICMPRGSPSPS